MSAKLRCLRIKTTKRLRKALSASISQALVIVSTAQVTGLDIMARRTWILIAASALLAGLDSYFREYHRRNRTTH